MATECGQVYKCEACGNITLVVHPGGGELVCCGQPMKLMVENTVDASKEKHVPVIEKTAGGYKVKIGAVPHPMEEKHYIEWIECMAGDMVMCKILGPGKTPEADFPVCSCHTGPVTARAYCNLHGLWKTQS